LFVCLFEVLLIGNLETIELIGSVAITIIALFHKKKKKKGK